MWTILLFLCAVFVQSGATGEKDDRNKRSVPRYCSRMWTQHGNRCYRHVTDLHTWTDAELYCVGMGANLASVHSFSEYTFLQQLVGSYFNSHPYTWIGGTDAVKDRLWFWSDGSPFHFSNWDAGEPNNAGGREPCLMMNFGDHHQWNDVLCDKTYGFICSFKLPETSAFPCVLW